MRLKGVLAHVYKCAFTHPHMPTHTYTQIMLGLGNLFHLFCQLRLNEHMGLGNKSIIHSTSIYHLPVTDPGAGKPPVTLTSQSWIADSAIHNRKGSELWLRWPNYDMTYTHEAPKNAVNKPLGGSSHQKFTPEGLNPHPCGPGFSQLPYDSAQFRYLRPPGPPCVTSF